ncbi:hypothetical protein CEXT_353411 [Caerostris extrusa]|uniref:Uncharacterized protein n=1 Tax=Caerostris extrusa TaxID=172846 RepID=A0AAV4QG47_CAEEX|nr:hypothetical protein CEXT_353411 [Caerostris extrusa]
MKRHIFVYWKSFSLTIHQQRDFSIEAPGSNLPFLRKALPLPYNATAGEWNFYISFLFAILSESTIGTEASTRDGISRRDLHGNRESTRLFPENRLIASEGDRGDKTYERNKTKNIGNVGLKLFPDGRDRKE